MSRREGLDLALTGEATHLSDSNFGEVGGESESGAGFCSKPKEAINSTKEGRELGMAEGKEGGRW